MNETAYVLITVLTVALSLAVLGYVFVDFLRTRQDRLRTRELLYYAAEMYSHSAKEQPDSKTSEWRILQDIVLSKKTALKNRSED